MPFFEENFLKQTFFKKKTSRKTFFEEKPPFFEEKLPFFWGKLFEANFRKKNLWERTLM